MCWLLGVFPSVEAALRNPLSAYYRLVCNTTNAKLPISLQWRHNESVSNHRGLDCLLKRLFRRRPKKTSMLCVTGLCEDNPPVTGVSPHKWPVTRSMFPDDVTMITTGLFLTILRWYLSRQRDKQPCISSRPIPGPHRGEGLWFSVLSENYISWFVLHVLYL